MEEKMLYSVDKYDYKTINKAYGVTADLVEAASFAARVCKDTKVFETIKISEIVERTGGLDRHYSAQKLRLEEGSELEGVSKSYDLKNPEDVELLNQMLKAAAEQKLNK